DMTESFLEHGYVKKHFRHPDASWKESTEPTKSGIDYITKYLTPTCNPIIRIERAKTLIQQLQESLYSELEVFYEGGDLQEKLKKANLNGSKVLMFLTGWNSKNSGFGSLLDKFMIREDEAWKVYWDLQNSAVIKEERKESAGEDISKMLTTTKETFQNLGINFDEGKKIEDNLEELQKFLGVDKESLAGLLEASGIEMEKLVSDRPASKKTKTEYYATSLISTWISKISELKTGDTLNEMGITKEISELTINELIENRKRTKLKEVIVENVHTEVSNFAFSNNFDIVAHISTVLVNDFVRTAGWKYIPDGERPKIKEVPVFSEANISTPAKENLQMNIKYPGINLFSQWVLGVKESFKANVLFSSNVKDDANVAANNMLGDILKKIR
ncbi:MAG: putative virulence factor, partial [Bacteroidetes bacterium]|nr:putative virulence factor [Bacteroidota bacterium]